jgi:hypothetical protein
MGTRGPAPKRDATRAGHRSKAYKADTIVCRDGVTAPHPDEAWHPRAREAYDDFAISGQTKYWEPSDWRMLLIACDNLDRHYTAARPSAEMFKHTMDILKALGATEADRRRMRIEVERPEDGDDEETEATDSVRSRLAALAAGDGGA